MYIIHLCIYLYIYNIVYMHTYEWEDERCDTFKKTPMTFGISGYPWRVVGPHQRS